ncbi:hypothetical protein PHJA_000645100 [Phtheirospermum japonicum]|uniref:Uncharacterized protein n=1 Tax=Phtheirospermum japonicum TaxID=374723 RepID=A0A830BLC0_9LAMI|nr:hypothetical protein PHJA_000645100 [Phtheirospermum japonicum]
MVACDELRQLQFSVMATCLGCAGDSGPWPVDLGHGVKQATAASSSRYYGFELVKISRSRYNSTRVVGAPCEGQQVFDKVTSEIVDDTSLCTSDSIDTSQLYGGSIKFNGCSSELHVLTRRISKRCAPNSCLVSQGEFRPVQNSGLELRDERLKEPVECLSCLLNLSVLCVHVFDTYDIPNFPDVPDVFVPCDYVVSMCMLNFLIYLHEYDLDDLCDCSMARDISGTGKWDSDDKFFVMLRVLGKRIVCFFTDLFVEHRYYKAMEQTEAANCWFWAKVENVGVWPNMTRRIGPPHSLPAHSNALPIGSS